jgi:hypothetical protein
MSTVPQREFSPVPPEMKKFAARYRLQIKRDECGEPVIPGKRGASHLYFEEGKLCMIMIDSRVHEKPTWDKLGGKQWRGDISLVTMTLRRGERKGETVTRRVQDAKVIGIPFANRQAGHQHDRGQTTEGRTRVLDIP